MTAGNCDDQRQRALYTATKKQVERCLTLINADKASAHNAREAFLIDLLYGTHYKSLIKYFSLDDDSSTFVTKLIDELDKRRSSGEHEFAAQILLLEHIKSNHPPATQKERLKLDQLITDLKNCTSSTQTQTQTAVQSRIRQSEEVPIVKDKPVPEEPTGLNFHFTVEDDEGIRPPASSPLQPGRKEPDNLPPAPDFNNGVDPQAYISTPQFEIIQRLGDSARIWLHNALDVAYPANFPSIKLAAEFDNPYSAERTTWIARSRLLIGLYHEMYFGTAHEYDPKKMPESYYIWRDFDHALQYRLPMLYMEFQEESDLYAHVMREQYRHGQTKRDKSQISDGRRSEAQAFKKYIASQSDDEIFYYKNPATKDDMERNINEFVGEVTAQPRDAEGNVQSTIMSASDMPEKRSAGEIITTQHEDLHRDAEANPRLYTEWIVMAHSLH